MMNKESINTQDSCAATVERGAQMQERLGLEGYYVATCVGPLEQHREEYIACQRAILRGDQGNVFEKLYDRYISKHAARARARIVQIPTEVKWQDDIRNTVMTLGKNDALDKYLAGSAYTAAFFMGLISSVSFSAIAAGDASGQINGTNGWKEAGPSNAPNYSSATRPAMAFSSAAAGVKATSAAVAFAISGAGTVKGCFAITNSTKEGTAGILLSAGLFTGGDKVVGNGDTLNVTWQLSA